jgi:hypothetical protein
MEGNETLNPGIASKLRRPVPSFTPRLCFVFVSFTFMNEINLIDLFSPGVRMVCSCCVMHCAATMTTDKYSLASSDGFCNYRRTVIFDRVNLN